MSVVWRVVVSDEEAFLGQKNNATEVIAKKTEEKMDIVYVSSLQINHLELQSS